MSNIIYKYFTHLSLKQQQQFDALLDIYKFWNSQINVISRKDIEYFYERHVLHSLAISKVISFAPSTSILDVGCGGGFPGIPLAILYPECNFLLVDSIAKKIKVVNEVAKALELNNVVAKHIRAEEVPTKVEFVVTRAVTVAPTLVNWVQNKISKKQFNALPNGILFLKGGELQADLSVHYKKSVIHNISDFYDEPFFETKKVVYLPM